MTEAGEPALDAEARQRIEAILDALEDEARAPTTVRDRERARLVHVADSLSGLDFVELREASRICDVGAGAGFPGLVLAAALPAAELVLVESVARKCEFIRDLVARVDLPNVEIVCDRAETYADGGGREHFTAVTARAVGRLSTLAELASPLLAAGGHLLAWKGRRDADEEAELARAAGALAMEPAEIRAVGPYAGSRNRHLHLVRKARPTPPDLPRRPGMAKKRPRGSR